MGKRCVQFSKYNPSGNMTVLVHSKHAKSEYATIANQIMATTHIHCEQVGFIESTDPQQFHLVMSGNEFCGNAAISFMHYLKQHDFIDHSDMLGEANSMPLQMHISGRSDLVTCEMHRDGYYAVSMPQPKYIKHAQLTLDGQIFYITKIVYESYLHVVIPVERITAQLQKEIERFVQTTRWDKEFKTIGVMLFNRETQYLTPLIYLPEVQSMIWENSCGSGAASIGIFENIHNAPSCEGYKVYQPGGHIIVTSHYHAQTQTYQATIKGRVSMVATGTAYIE